ncbi:MAG: hypothetical protein ACTHNU_17765 [Gaiellales bacterium]
MKPSRIAVLVALGALACGVALVRPSAQAATPRPVVVGASLREWALFLGRTSVPHGWVTFSVSNYGADDHSLVVQRVHGRVIGRTALLQGMRSNMPTVVRLKLKLAAGRYAVYCGVPGHRALMHGTLTVR